jgi:putative selenate reductase FAD-binding subunit
MIERFYKPKTIDEAVSLKRKLKDQAVFLAGGTMVNSKDFPLRPEHIISLEALKQNRIAARKGEVRIGALCTLQRVLESDDVPECLKKTLRQVVSRNIRNAATIGGHVAAAKSCSDIIPMLIALQSELEIYKPSAKLMSVEDYLETRPDGLITEIIIPKAHTTRVQSFNGFRASANSPSMLTAAVSMHLEAGKVEDAIIVVGGVGRKITRLTYVENKLHGKPLPDTNELEQLVQKHPVRQPCRPSCIMPCLAASIEENADYLRYQAGVLVAQTINEACRQKEVCS